MTTNRYAAAPRTALLIGLFAAGLSLIHGASAATQGSTPAKVSPYAKANRQHAQAAATARANGAPQGGHRATGRARRS